MDLSFRLSLMLLYLCLLLFSVAECVSKISGSSKSTELSFTYPSSIQDSESEGGNCTTTADCPLWFKCNVTNSCECNDMYSGIIKCDTEIALVLDCYCATFDDSINTTVAGSCFYNCESNDKVLSDVLYNNITDELCDPFNRTGVLCGKCKDDLYPHVYSFDMSCTNCTDDRANWVIFFIIATVPSTLFFFIVIIFKINITSSYLHGFVLFSQGISFPANMRIILRAVSKKKFANEISRSIASMYGFWNLDFFRPLLPQICLRLSTLQILSLDYIVAVYPLLLIISSYILVILYYRNVKVIVYISHPFRRLFARFQNNWNIKSSIMEAYATFFLLSYTKFLGASFDILMATHVYSSEGGKSTLASYYDANLKYFQGDHLPLGVTALTVLIIFVVIPTLILLLYPFRYSQIVLRKLKLNSTLLDSFVSPFYKCYKDGSDPNTYDCRWFSALFLILRIILPLVYAFTLGSVFLPLAVIIIFIFVMILITVKPYKPSYSHFIKFDVTFLLLLSLFFLSMISIDVSSIKDHRLVHASYSLTVVFGIVPLLYVLLVIILWIISKRNYGPELISRLQAIWRFQPYEPENSMENEVPDRLLHPTEYMHASTSLKASASEALTKQTY